MVDLVKIRKKKAEKQKEDEATRAAAGETSPAVAPADDRAVASSDQAAGRPADPEGERPGGRAPDRAEPPRVPERAGAGAPDPPEAAPPSKLEKFKAQAGQRREFRTSAQEAAAVDQIELLTFVIAGEQYAVDIERIVEIVTPRPVTRIPNADPSVVGIISLRGTIVTLVDVRRKLRHAGAPAVTDDARIVVIDNRSEMVGFMVDRVLRVTKVAPGDIQPHPVVHSTELDDSVRGVFRLGGALTILLDLDKLLDHRALAATS